jgi:hypothetical protein
VTGVGGGCYDRWMLAAFARCEQKEFKIDARSVVAPDVARGRPDGGRLRGCRDQREKWSRVKNTKAEPNRAPGFASSRICSLRYA